MDWMLLPIHRYAEFDGRSGRTEYWMFALFQLLIVAAFLAIFFLVGGFPSEAGGEMNNVATVLLVIFALIYLVLFFVPGIAVTVRRWHDLGQSGWFIVLFGVLGASPTLVQSPA